MTIDQMAVWLHDVVELAVAICIPLIELLAVAVIVGYSLTTVYRFCCSPESRQSDSLNQRLGRGLSLGLGLYLASEVLQTALIKDYQDFAMISLLILLRTAIGWLLQRSTTDNAVLTKDEPSIARFDRYSKPAQDAVQSVR